MSGKRHLQTLSIRGEPGVGSTNGPALAHETIDRVVRAFYARAREHPDLAATFARVEDWDEHIARISHFWWVSLGGRRYRPDRFQVGPRHVALGVTGRQVDAWLDLFEETLSEQVADDQARQDWLDRAHRMGRVIRGLGAFYERRDARTDDPHRGQRPSARD
ncbi:hemoglobin [Alkalispirillum mobile]|uniref:Hemoglobin n=1 Tax=Alkalispirillum mobile TaxID=85925 RepID=A0A498BW83_9GAMM|nr:group III truncated hemoglobin [Alkalispirillum mobile]RLK47147.1 hemoglobin [Alkalispirillum mobile]